MKMSIRSGRKWSSWLTGLVALTSVLLIACGGAATSTPQPTNTPVSTQAPTAAPPDPLSAPLAPTPRAAPTSTAAPAVPPTSKLRRLIYATAIIPTETNRPWLSNNPSLFGSDPFLETLIDMDVSTGGLIPRLADRWEMSLDAKNLSFYLHKGVPFHFGFGEFTAKDVAHTHSLLSSAESIASFSGYWRGVKEVEVVNDYQVVFRMKNTTVVMPFIASRGGDMMLLSKAQWDKEGIGGIDKKPAGTGSYQYAGRRLGEAIFFQRAEKHWRGEQPQFEELEIRWAKEDATRLALLLAQEAHMADLPRDLQDEAVRRGLGKVISSNQISVHLAAHFGGQHHIKGDPKFQPDVPWNDKRVRQAMNVAINRKELSDKLFKGRVGPIYVTGFFDTLEGWDPSWEGRFNELYGYNPDKAKALLKEAGYPPPATVKGTIHVYARAEVPELPQVWEALDIYWKRVGIEMRLLDSEPARATSLRRQKDFHCCLSANAHSYKPTEDFIGRAFSNQPQATSHFYEDDFIEENVVAWRDTLDPKERDRLARGIGNYLFENFASMPLFSFYLQVVANPKVVDGWAFPGTTVGGVSHFNLIRAAK